MALFRIRKRLVGWGITLLGALLLAACQGRGAAPAAANTEATLQALVATQMAAQAPTPVQASGPTAAVPPATPTPGPTATRPASPTPSPTVGPPMLTVSVATRCRQGPGKAFPQVGAVQVGQTVPVVGRWGEYWVVTLPDGVTCWVWGRYATITGDVTHVASMTPPPTPPQQGTIAGLVFSDTNFNGQYDPGTDHPVRGIDIFLHAATAGQCDPVQLGQAQSNAQGKFAFTVEPATYCVWAQMAGMPVCHDRDIVTVHAGETVTVAFYMIPCSPLDPTCRCP